MSVSTNPITKRYYPKLSEVITVEDLPEFLNFVENGLDNLLDNTYYKNFQFSKSARGDAAFYSLEIVSKNVGIDLPFGLRFVLNPDEAGDAAISAFPVSLQYQWEVLAFLRSFNLPSFAFTPEAFYELGLKVFRVSEDQVLAHILNYFVDPTDPDKTKYQQLVDDINILYPAAGLVLPPSPEPTVSSVAALISTNAHIPKGISALMFALYIIDSSLDETKKRLQQFYNLIVPDGIEDYIHKLITPKAKATLTLSAGIEFPSNVLKPVSASGVPIAGAKSIFKFAEATLYVDTEAGIGYQSDLAGSLLPALPALHQIGDTGLTIGFTNAKLDLSTKTNIPEADAAGYPVDFVGLYVQQAVIGFSKFGKDNPGHESAQLIAENLLIGTGGVSGTIRLEDHGLLHRKFGDFEVELDTFSITFRQNAILSSAISGKLILSKFLNDQGQPATVLIDIMIRDSGDFSVSAKPQNFVPKITWPEVFELIIRSFKMGEENGHFYIEIAGTLNFIANIPILGEILPKNVEINKLRIWDNGHLEFSGGVLPLPISFSLKVGPVKMEVDKLTLSPHKRIHNGEERQYLCIGFDGVLNTGRAGVSVGGNGMKYYFSVDDGPFDQYFGIDGITIDMTIPGNVPKDDAQFILKGFLNVQQPSSENSLVATEYTGAVSFEMPQIGLAGSAGMRLSPDVPAFVVDIGLELPTPIPVWAGLGIYAFRGLIGQHYLPSKKAAGLTDDATWWDYYKAPGPISRKKGVQVDKFGNESGFSIGAGATIATSFDDGFTFSAKLFIMLGLPRVFLLQGQAGILSTRLGLDDERDPPFSALIAIGDDSFTANLAVDYDIPDNGSIFSLHGELDIAFFFNNASGWYLNLGKDQPDSARIQAKIFSVFQGYAYLMISARGIKAGAGASFGFSVGNKLISAGFNVYINTGGHISFKPFQVGGFIEMGGSAHVKVLFIKISLDVKIGLAVEAPHPVNIIGYLEVSVKVIFKRIRARLDIRIGPHDDSLSILEVPISVLDTPDDSKGYLPVMATNILTSETFTVNYVTATDNDLPSPGSTGWKYDYSNTDQADSVTIPLDSFIDIELLKPVKPGDLLGGSANQVPDGYKELFPPDKGVNEQVAHEFSVTGLDILVWKGDFSTGQWVTYNIYEAVTAIAAANSGPGGIQLDTLKPGYWQFTDKDKYNKIRLLSQDMFSYKGKTDISLPAMDALNFAPKDLFCFDHILKPNVIDWTKAPAGTTYPPAQTVFYDGLELLLNGLTATVTPGPGGGSNNLQLSGNYGTLLITLPQPLSQVELDFSGNDHHISINFLSTTYLPGFFNVTIPVTVSRQNNTIANGSAAIPVSYSNQAQTVDQILLTFDGRGPSDYDGDLVFGGHTPLPDAYTNSWLSPQNRQVEIERSLTDVTLYHRSLTAGELSTGPQPGDTGITASWPMTSAVNANSAFSGLITGSPDLVASPYLAGSDQALQQLPVFSFSATTDALIIPFSPALKVENSSFAFRATLIFDPFVTGVCTLWSKLTADSDTGLRKGYSIHLSQQAPADTAYNSPAGIPPYSIWLVFYSGTDHQGIEVTDVYSTSCSDGTILKKQYKQLAVSVNRVTGQLDIYLDKILKTSVPVPAALDVFTTQQRLSYLKQLSYLTPALQARAADNDSTEEKVISEVQVMSNMLNKTIQPIWRPDSIFAVKIHTQDTVTHKNYLNAQPKTHTFGFKTAGPLGHFQQHNKAYQQLQLEDRTGEFKLASLKAYIDYNRSYPDAQGQYDLSKPVFCHLPQIRLYFTESYMNAMFSNWDNYQGLNPVSSSLELALIDPAKQVIIPELVWTERSIPITLDNYKSLPASQQLVFLFNQAAGGDGCNPLPNPVVKKIRQATYQFIHDLIAGKFYTAIFTSVYQPQGATEQRTEIHRFSFQTSLYNTFQDQVASVVLDATPGAERYAVTPLQVDFSQNDIEQRLKKLINGTPDDDPQDTLHYAVPFDRLVYGGLALLHLEPVLRTAVFPVINTDPGNAGVKRILGILISNPEPFNDPKFTAAELSGTVSLTLSSANNTVTTPDGFIYIHSRNTSSVFITNQALDIPEGSAVFHFIQKAFNGIDYDQEEASAGPINISF